MLPPDDDKILANLIKIEFGLSKIYDHMSRRENFTRPVKAFWETMAREEDIHGRVFQEIRDKAGTMDSFVVQLKIDMDRLRAFVDQVNDLLVQVRKADLSEVEAFQFGQLIEAELDEAEFLKGMVVSDSEIEKKIRKIEVDTKKHRMILIQHSKGYIKTE
ncbi:MAG: hypothetical protein KKB20_14055 [Proteobacteria bacterium]|nr:hypothetical protein [Pseudomonadota bacterium]